VGSPSWASARAIHGIFCFADLGTTDAAAAKAFYTDLFGWQADEQPRSPRAAWT
jgi:uncharacterized protein